ncbi:MAG: CAP domain-containing protein, partial [Candidatus Spechtbacterales bacterium]
MVRINPTKLLGFAVGLLLLAGGFGYLSYSGNTASIYRQFVETFIETKQVANEIVHTAEQPAPLQGSREQRVALQTRAGVIAETNKHRATEELAPLTMNAQLNASAQVKLDDLFARQYFAHSAPTGEGPSDLIEAQGY